MKVKFTKAALLLVTLALLFSGCAYLPDDTAQDKTAEYLATIASLEAQIAEQKAEFSESETRYKQTIVELEARIAQLSAPQTPPNGETESVKFRYRVEDGNAVITGYEGNAALLTVPDTLDGYPVTAIGERAFESAAVTAVVLPEGLQKIGWFAFYNCRELINVTIPASVDSIGYAVFDGCGALTLYCPADSYAERYAHSYGISCVAK